MSFSFELGGLDQAGIVGRRAEGQPRYSSTVYRRGGGYVRRWSDDLTEVMAAHDHGKTDPELDWVITFDHLAEEDLAYDFGGDRKTPRALRAECDEALDRMWDRWMAEERLGGGGGR